MANSAIGATGAIAALPAGVMIDYAGGTAPSGWIMCDGAAVSRTVYAGLFAAIGTAYGAGDGSTTFNLPDFRGRFARYMDNMGTVAGAASRDTSRVLGAAQTDAMQGHRHSVSESSHSHSMPGQLRGVQVGSSFNSWGDYTTAYNLPNTNSATTGLTVGSPITDASGSPRTASETRPINLSCNRIIKY